MTKDQILKKLEWRKSVLRLDAIAIGEDLMPGDCAAIIKQHFSRAERMELGTDTVAAVIMDMMSAADYACDLEYALDEAEYIAGGKKSSARKIIRDAEVLLGNVSAGN